MYVSDVAAVPSSTDSTRPTKKVWSPVRNSSTVTAVSQPGGTGEEPRIVVAHPDPVPENERRHAAREVQRDVVLVAGEDRRAPRTGIAQELVQRCLVRDRDADERRLERQ